METLTRRTFNPPSISTTHRDITDERYRDLRRPRKVKFYCNGDRYFKGKRINITPHRYLTFNDLLNDLTSKLPYNVQLPYGVRQIFTPVAGRRIRDIEELEDGQNYVCGGFEAFKTIKYGDEKTVEPWSMGKASHDLYPDVTQSYGSPRSYFGAFQPTRPLRHSYPRRPPGSYGQRAGAGHYWAPPADTQALMKPKVITVVRNGEAPRANVKILLNRRSVQSFEQLSKDINEAFGPQWKGNRIRKIFTIKGKEVQGISDFFRDDDVFVALGKEQLSTSDVQEILEDVYPDSPYAKNLLKEWGKVRKRYNRHKAQEPAVTVIEVKTGKGDDDKLESKFDSGLGSDSSHREDGDAKEDVSPRGKGRKKKAHREEPTIHEEDMAVRLERERVKASEEERLKARRRMQKRLEAERRALNEERRKHALVPVRAANDPFRKMQEERENEQRRQREQDEEDKERMRELEAQRRKLKKAEERRKRREAEEKARAKGREEDEPRVIVVVKDDGRTSRASVDPRASKASNEPRTGRRSKLKFRETSPRSSPVQQKSDDEPVTSKSRNTSPTKDNKSKEKDEGKDETPKPTIVVEKKKTASDPPKEPKAVPKKEAPIEPQKVHKTKKQPGIIYKTKVERQTSNLGHILDKYELGKIMGDGNFAVVKQALLKGTSSEYAMKIIDKAKLKGKEHMIENEIELMKRCAQPNIVKLVEEYETHDEIYLVMELVKGGDLFDAITQSVKFSEAHSAGMVSDLTQALFYLHSRSIVHRDLKPENLLVCRNKDGSITLKLADFGLALEVHELIYTVCGTPTYVAPEILAETGYGLEVDMWAVGVITYILLCGFPPFRSPDRNQTELFEFIKAGEYEFLSPYWDKISKSATDLISRLLVVDRRRRYTAIQTLSHAWVITRGGSVAPPANIDEYRHNMMRELESQAKINQQRYSQGHYY